MAEKVIVITGATSGVGQAAAEELAAQGARIVFVARDRKRAEDTLRRLRARNPKVDHAVHLADLSLLSEMKRVASEIAAERTARRRPGEQRRRRFFAPPRHGRRPGATFALNHMAYFVVTLGLLDRLRAAKQARVVSTASMTYAFATMNFDDLQSEKKFDGPDVYARSKLANILFTRELARRLDGTGVTANCFHPGFVNSRLGTQDGGISAIWGMSMSGAISPEQGAKTLIYLASSPKVAESTGAYFVTGYREKLAPHALNDADAHRLWSISARIAGIGS